MALLDLDALLLARVTHEPSSFTMVRDCLHPANAPTIRQDLPSDAYPGLLPMEAIGYRRRFGELIAQPRSSAVAKHGFERAETACGQ